MPARCSLWFAPASSRAIVHGQPRYGHRGSFRGWTSPKHPAAAPHVVQYRRYYGSAEPMSCSTHGVRFWRTAMQTSRSRSLTIRDAPQKRCQAMRRCSSTRAIRSAHSTKIRRRDGGERYRHLGSFSSTRPGVEPHGRRLNGLERKRGKLQELTALCRGASRFDTLSGQTTLWGCKYVSRSTRHQCRVDSARQCRTSRTPDVLTTTRSWGVSPKLQHPPAAGRHQHAERCPLHSSRSFSPGSRDRPYTRAVSDVYQDLFQKVRLSGRGSTTSTRCNSRSAGVSLRTAS